MTGRVLVVGDVVTDVLVVPAEPVAPGSDTRARVRTLGGGQGANTAAWLAYAHRPVTLVAAVGDDAAGRQRSAELAAAGVDLAVRTVGGARTGTLVVLVDGEQRSIFADRGAADRLRPADIDAALARAPDATHLHLSGYLLLAEQTRPAGRHALTVARRHGLTTSVGAGSAQPLRQVGPAAFLAWVAGVDLLLANADEAAVLAPAVTGAAAQARLLGTAGKAAVVTGGAAGACWADAGGLVSVEAPASPVVDPTGAGDAFGAGLLASWLATGDPGEALRAGARLGAAAVAMLGARPPR